MTSLAGILYGIFVLVYVITGIFVLYHLQRYSINPAVGIVMALTFVVITITILVINLTLFGAIPLDQLVPDFGVHVNLPSSF